MVFKDSQWLSVLLSNVINGPSSISYQLLSMVFNEWLSIGYERLLMDISHLSMVINGYWLSTSYQWLSMVIKFY